MVARMAETGQRCDEPLHKKEEGRPTQDTLVEPGLGGSPTTDGTIAFDGQDVT
jgi:hypothetical protein